MSITGTAAGVPFVAVPPSSPGPSSPVVVAWHLLDPPRTEAAFAAALPLAGLDAWRVYLGLPLCGARSGGPDELMGLVGQDAVRLVYGAITAQAQAEFGPAYAELEERFGFGSGPLVLVGGSLGSSVALSVLAERADVAATVLVSPLVQLTPLVTLLGEEFGMPYAWDDGSRAIADRMDFVARAAELGDAPLRLVVGADDHPVAFRAPADALVEARPGAELAVVPGVEHALAEEPGVEPAPQTAAAGAVDRLVVGFVKSVVSPATV